jgi:hypothetical protein
MIQIHARLLQEVRKRDASENLNQPSCS